MTRMRIRPVAAATLVLLSLTGLTAATRLYLWPGAPAPLFLAVPAPPPATEPRPAFPTTTRGVDVRPGDSLVSALARGGVDARAAGEITALLSRKGAELRKLRPRAALEVTWNVRREPIEVRYAPSAWVRFVAAPVNGSWAITRSEIAPDVRVEAVQGRVRRSLFEAVEEAGESPQLVMALVEIFSSDFDFTADTRPGDRFRLLVEKRYAGDRFVDYGRILAAQYASEGRTLSGVGFARSGDARWAYYDPRGRSLRKSFLKSPLEFTRVTSGFTYARPHPILGGVRPHLAVDYAAPWGTADRSEVRQQLEQVKPTVPRVDYEHRYLEGGPVHEIVAFAEREHIDLIVMGSHGRTGLARLLMGSVAEGVARRAPCPVLIVKQPVASTPESEVDDAMVLKE